MKLHMQLLPENNENISRECHYLATRVKFVDSKLFLLPPPVFYATDRSKAVVPVLLLFFVALWFILRGALSFKVLPCSVSSYIFIPLSIMIASLGEEGACLCTSRAFVCLLFFFICCCCFFVLFPFLLVSVVGYDL